MEIAKTFPLNFLLQEAEMGILEDTEVFTQTPLKILPTLVPIGISESEKGTFI